MKAMNIDFVPAQGAGHRPGARTWILLASILGLLALAGGVFGSRLDSQASAMRLQAQEIDAARDAQRSAAFSKQQLAPDVADAINGVIRMLDYPLIDLLGQLEHYSRPNVALMSLEVGPVRSNLRIVIQAASFPEALDYLEDLRSDARFQNIAITRQESGVGEGANAWRFTFEMPQNDAVPRASSATAGREPR